MNTMDAPSAMGRKAWVVIACAALIVTWSIGVRQSFGLFLRPIGMDIDIDRQSFGLAIALQNLLFGLAQPFVGALADQWGAGRITVAGALLYVAGLVLAGFASSALGLHVSLGLMIGIALSATSFVVVLGAVGRAVPPEKRSLAFGITTAGGSLGQFLLLPGTQALLGEVGWRNTMFVLAGLVATTIVLALGVAGKPRHGAENGMTLSIRQALGEAAGHRDYWLLNAGFCVCGFHIAFIMTHMPAFLADEGLPSGIGAMSLAVIGLFNILGSYLYGVWGGRMSKARLLSGLYLLRAVSMALLLALPLSSVTAPLFSMVMGFTWLATLPLTSGLVGQIFGMRYLSMLYGIVFLSHQIGSFFGAWASGYVYDLTGSYDAVWMASIVLALIATLIHLPIRETPIARVGAAA